MGRPRLSANRIRRFFAPAYGLRRYAFAALLGLIVLFAGAALSFKVLLAPLAQTVAQSWRALVAAVAPGVNVDQTNHLMGGALLIAGALLVNFGATGVWRRLNEPRQSHRSTSVFGAYKRRRQLAHGPRVVAIGGGTGLSTLLRGLKQHTSNITAIVTVTDDGGSSGKLVQDLGIIPPGDIRNCLVALADAERLMTDLFQHRFTSKAGSLSGHSVGNLLIAGFIEQTGGDLDRALAMASEVLAIRGRVVPSTDDHVRLRALMDDGTEVCGETAIVSSGKTIRRVYIDPADPLAHPGAVEAIAEAELICIGPGSVYTSVVPNLLVPGIAEAIGRSQAPKAYVCNVMTQHGESDAFTAAEHLVAIQANVSTRVFDFVLVNTGVPSQAALDKYRVSQQEFVAPDTDRVASMGYRPITGDFMNETDFVRHDPIRVAARLMELV